MAWLVSLIHFPHSAVEDLKCIFLLSLIAKRRNTELYRHLKRWSVKEVWDTIGSVGYYLDGGTVGWQCVYRFLLQICLPVRLIHLKKFGYCVDTFDFWGTGMCHTSMALYFYRASKKNVYKPTANSWITLLQTKYVFTNYKFYIERFCQTYLNFLNYIFSIKLAHFIKSSLYCSMVTAWYLHSTLAYMISTVSMGYRQIG
jgi:hypothetical protein